MPNKRKEKKKTEKKEKGPMIREQTLHIHRHLLGIGFKKRAPRAIKEIRAFARKQMRTKDIRLDVKLNKAVWAQGIRNVPFRMRLRLERKRNEDEEAHEKMYTLVSHVQVPTLKRLRGKIFDKEKKKKTKKLKKK